MSGARLCNRKGCRREAISAYDVRPSFSRAGFVDGIGERHYEVCAKHEAEFFPRGAGFLRSDLSERIKSKLVPS